MKSPQWSPSTRATRLIALTLCLVLVVPSLFLPLSSSTIASAEGIRRANVSRPTFIQSLGLSGAPTKLFASFLALLQGGGGLPSVPGSNLPDLAVARTITPVDPVAPAAIPSNQDCTDCTPCTTCGPGSANHEPVVHAGGPYYGTAGASIEVTGLGSFDVDPGDGISLYAWSFGDSSGVVHGATPTHTYQSAGEYTISLTVTDEHNVSATASTTASITPPPPSVPPSGTTSGNASQFISQSLPATMTAGLSYSVSVTMRNTGTTTWTAARLYRLGSQNPQDNIIWGRARISLPTSVAPGADVTFTFTVIAPIAGLEEPPLAQFQWRMIEEGVEWFGDYTTNQSVAIVPNNARPPGSLHNVSQFSDLFASRIAVHHRTGQPGEDLLSGNYNWAVGLVGLAGRSGMNLNLGLSYNSLAAWTKVDPTGHMGVYGVSPPTSFTFDADRGFPSVGFRIGFPSIQGPFLNRQTGGNSYLALIPSGGRVELRQIGESNVYEAADSSYLQLLDGGNGSLLLRTTDGTQLAFWSINSEYRCTEVKDPNGNYLTIKYDPINGTANLGRMTSIIDTLGHTINFNYDANYRLQSITQQRNGQTHVWATFGYTTIPIEPNFNEQSYANPAEGEPIIPAPPIVLGVPESQTVSVLTQVGLDDGSRYNFDYTTWGQVYRVSHSAADGHELNYASYNLPLDDSESQTDCPRFTQREVWAENWNDNDPVSTSFQIEPDSNWGEMTVADDTANEVTYREYFTTDYNDWRRGLVTLSEVLTPDSITPKKTTITEWTQDDINLDYPLNPRPTTVTISDADGNRRRTSVEYTAFGLPSDVFEWGPYGASDWKILRRTHTDYNLSLDYVSRRIFGLVAGQYLFAPDAPNSDSIQTLMAKTTFEYDGAICSGWCYFIDLNNQNPPNAPGPSEPPVVQHDNNYSSSFDVGRGLLATVKRWDAFDEMNVGKTTTSSMLYNIRGSLIRTVDPLQHITQIEYTDSFSNDGIGSNPAPYVTMAYPTLVRDADGYSSSAKYNYALGLVTRKQDPKGAAQTTEYDSARRVKRVTNSVNSAYTRFVYPPSQTITNTFTTIKDLQHEAYTATVTDGAGRVRGVARDLPDTVGHYSGQFTTYDLMGRAIQKTNPTRMNSAWAAQGDDLLGWHSSYQTYDWQGRLLITTNPDGTTKKASYGGCGCAGGATVTLTDEGTFVGMGTSAVEKKRQQKIYSDSLGRTIRTEVLNWDGPEEFGIGGTIYSTTVNAYNARDQITQVLQYAGAANISNAHQDTVMTYDGFGRLKTKHFPEQDANTATSYDYKADDTIEKITDARGASQTFSYNPRHLVTHVSYQPVSGVLDSPDVSFTYDVAGNRTSMADGMGTQTYHYDQLSRMDWEERVFDLGTYRLNYAYNLAGQLTSINDQAFSTTVTYAYDIVGQLTDVTGTGYPNVPEFASNMQYRASGSLKGMSYGNGRTLTVTHDSRLRPSSYSIPGVMSKTYQYYDDGRLDYSQDVNDSRYDRKSQYDHAGRLTTALSGAEALGAGATDNRPYKQSYQQDVWGNLTNRTGKQWARPEISEPATYANNKRNGWNYDASGNWLDEGVFNSLERKYDAAGRLVKIIHPAFPTNPKRTDDYDGDGQRVRSGYHTLQPEYEFPLEHTYYLRSSVLGGQIVSEVQGNGQKSMAYIYYPSGGVIAVQKLATPNDVAAYVLWRHSDSRNLSARATDTAGSVHGFMTSRYAAELDPLGADNALEDPGEPQLPDARDDFDPGWLMPSSAMGKCKFDGMPIDCGELANKMDLGFVAVEVSGITLDTVTGRRGVQRDVVSYGIGLFRVDLPYRTEDGIRFRDMVFYFAPQNNVSTRVDDALDLLNRNPKCEESLNEVLSRLAAKTRVKRFANIRSVLEQFRKDGSITEGVDGNSSVTDSFKDHTSIRLSVSTHKGLSESQNKDLTADRLLHELLHYAGGPNLARSMQDNQYFPNYEDPDIYEAWKDMGVIKSFEEWMQEPDVAEYYKKNPESPIYTKDRMSGSAQRFVCLGLRSSPIR